MKITGEDLERSVGGILSRFGIDKEEARKARRQLDTRIKIDGSKSNDLDYNEKYYVHFINRFAFVDLAVDDILIPTLSLIEQALYRRFYRLSFGFGKTWCQVSYSELRKACNISSAMTVRKGVKGLENKHCIKVITQSIQRKSPVYRVYLPCEMPQFLAMDIQTSVIFSEEKIEIQSVREILNSELDFSQLKISPLKISTLEELRQLIFSCQNTKFSALKNSSLTGKVNNDKLLEGEKKEKKSPIDILIDRSNIYTLSAKKIINEFYSGIGQEKVSKQKRERAENNIKELLDEGFTEEDIAFAVKWTINNSREKPYDFSLIKDTIGQATAAKKQEEEKEAKRLEIEQSKTKKMEQEKKIQEVRENIKSHKDKLSTEQKADLRAKALNEIRNTKGIKEEFITEILIEAKENELIAKTLNIDLSEIA